MQAIEKIHNNIEAAHDRHKSILTRRKDLKFFDGDKVFFDGDKVFLKLVSMRGKLRSRFFGPFEIMKRIGSVACQLALPAKL